MCHYFFFHILVCFTSTLSDPVYFFIAHGSHFQGGKSIQNDRQAPNRIVLVIIFKSIQMAKLRPRLFQLADFDISCVNASLFPLPNYFILDAHIHFPFLGVKQSLINMNTTIAQIWNAQSLFGLPYEQCSAGLLRLIPSHRILFILPAEHYSFYQPNRL